MSQTVEKKFYAVRRGRTTGIFTTWKRCKTSVYRFTGAEYKSFKDRQSAKTYLKNAYTERSYILVPHGKKKHAKSLGACWDKEVRLFYATNEVLPALLKHYSRFRELNLPDNREYGGNILYVDLIPRPMWFINLRSSIKEEDWILVRNNVYRRANWTCECCNHKRTIRNPIEAHERWEYKDGVQRLTRLVALCRRCHEATHYGHSRVRSKEETTQHLMKVRNETKPEVMKHIDEAYALWKERSNMGWVLDLGLIKKCNIPLIEISHQ